MNAINVLRWLRLIRQKMSEPLMEMIVLIIMKRN